MATATDKQAKGFSAEEKEAMRERARELKAEAKKGRARADGEAELLGKIAEMTGTDKTIAEKVHKLVRAAAPGLVPKTWYGMPAYAREGKVVCYFQSAAKFDARYATFGFNDNANIDDGSMWATSWALTKLTAADEKKLAALVKKSVS